MEFVIDIDGCDLDFVTGWTLLPLDGGQLVKTHQLLIQGGAVGEIGLPLHSDFKASRSDRTALQRVLGLQPSPPTVTVELWQISTEQLAALKYVSIQIFMSHSSKIPQQMVSSMVTVNLLVLLRALLQ